MDIKQFGSQIDRLARTFGKNAYPEERTELLWREIQTFPFEWLQKVVSGFIASSRHAPLISDFYEAIGEERERVYKIEKAKNTKETKEAMATLFSKEDVAMFCKTITDKMSGEIDDAKYKMFLKMLKGMPHPPRCKYCEGEGYIFARLEPEQGETVYRCCCPAGGDKKVNYHRLSPEDLLSVQR